MLDPETGYNGVGQTLGKTVNDHSYLWTPGSNKIDAYQVNGLNQYTNVGGATLAHDGNGNLTTDHRGRAYVYDAENVLRRANGLASGNATYRYWADGARREKFYNGGTTQFYHLGDQEIAEYNGGALLRRFVRLPGSVDETFLMIDYTSGSAVERWSHQNRLGSVVAVTNSGGAVVEKYRYSPYGESGLEGDGGFPFRFTGQKLDPETGLYYYKARYYDPETGRFLQTDPIGYEDQMNLYAYVGNDPVNATDPTGEFGIFGAIVGGGIELSAQLLTKEGRQSYARAGRALAKGDLKGALKESGSNLLQVAKGAALGAVGGGIASGVSKGVLAVNAANAARTGQQVGRVLQSANQVGADAIGGAVGGGSC